ncbi:amidohydrolase family protein [Cryptosporangium phraense]|uniref:amidohydrolase family protein n=1 Tax=Cryptosporangium phraense TaxID=2593070 RepID=UPI00197A9F9C|nr:amidohydrolase family protein [Cryptosporangium phraense]
MSGRIDAHVHLWNRVTDPQPWIDPETMAAIDADFGPVELAGMLADTGQDRAVVVQAGNDLGETGRLLCHDVPVVAGVVGWVDLTGKVDEQLDELGPGRLVGIRHLVHVDPDPDWLGRPDVGASLDRLAARGLAFDLVVRSWQLDLVRTVVQAHPEVRFVLDHLGGIAEAPDEAEWERGVRALAGLPNVAVKISGLAGIVPDAARLARVVGVALESFGPHRLMYGSDWPLANLGAGSVAWRSAVDALIEDLSDDERSAIDGGTASAWYRL